MAACAVSNCINNQESNPDRGIFYYYFPKHPLFARKWVSACWRKDAIDFKNARICSIHFDSDSYSTEYKIMDSTGHYKRILKYDAVPTLFLPNRKQIKMKEAIDQNLPICDIKHVTFGTNISQQTIPINTNIKILNVPENTSITNSKNIKIKQFQNLKDENKTLKEKISAVKSNIRSLQVELRQKTEAFGDADGRLQDSVREYDMLWRSRLKYSSQQRILSKVLSKCQLKILSGRSKTRWSSDDMAVAYTIWNLSNKRFYSYLTKKLNIPMPAISCIQKWIMLKSPENIKKAIKDEDCKKECKETNSS